MTVDELVRYVFEDAPSTLATGCAGWMAASRRFRSFVEINRDKLRKKVRTARDEAALLDLEAEVATAFRLVQEPRRLWRRYLRYNPRFVTGFSRQWLRTTLRGRHPSA